MNYQVRTLDPSISREVRAISSMHFDLLNWGPMARIGRFFLHHYCYTTLVRDGLLIAAICWIEGKPAGFVSFTKSSKVFHSQAFQRHPVRAVATLFGSFILSPRAILEIYRAVRASLSLSLDRKALSLNVGEILAIGVHSEYRSLRLTRKTGLDIGRELFFHAAGYLTKDGTYKMQMDVDAFNISALLFYKSIGGDVQPFNRNGESRFWITFDLNKIYRSERSLGSKG